MATKIISEFSVISIDSSSCTHNIADRITGRPYTELGHFPIVALQKSLMHCP